MLSYRQFAPFRLFELVLVKQRSKLRARLRNGTTANAEVIPHVSPTPNTSLIGLPLEPTFYPNLGPLRLSDEACSQNLRRGISHRCSWLSSPGQPRQSSPRVFITRVDGERRHFRLPGFPRSGGRHYLSQRDGSGF